MPITQAVATELPTDRPYTRVEALLSVTLDHHRGKTATLRGYAALWSWSTGKVSRFLSEIEVTLSYPKAAKKRDMRGTLVSTQPERWRDTNETLIFIDYNYLSAKAKQQQDVSVTETEQGTKRTQRPTKDTETKTETETETETTTTTTTSSSSNSGELNPFDMYLSAWRSRYEHIYGGHWRGDFAPGTYPVKAIAGLLRHVPIDDICRDVIAYIDYARSAKPTPLQFARWSAKRRNIQDPKLLELLR